MRERSGRREVLRTLGTGVAGALLFHPTPGPVLPATKCRAVVFDGLALFDSRPIGTLASRLFPFHGEQLAELFRSKLFQYQWLRTLGGRHADFWRVAGDALRAAARSLAVEVSPGQHDELLGAWLRLEPWPDVRSALDQLAARGLLLAPLANLADEIVEGAAARAGLRDRFDEVISTQRARTYKPDPRAYQLAVDALRVTRSEIVFVPSAAWDLAGAGWFGFRCFWVNRRDETPDELGVAAGATARSLTRLPQFVDR
jgi:2-haloacid dehalogenase